jgi:plasmid maintenance system antidote protein VapI
VERKTPAADLARQIEVPVNRITDIMKSQRSITAEIAIRFGYRLGTNAGFG